MFISVDIEADGPCPGEFSMIQLGAVVVRDLVINPDSVRTFYSDFKPISNKFSPNALKVTNTTREQCLEYNDPKESTEKFYFWLKEVSNNFNEKLFFISDNNGFDWQFVNYYFWRFLTEKGNPFGHSSTNLGSLYKGLQGDFFKSFKHLRKTKHTHNPVDDAMGNAEALVHMKNKMGLKIKL